MDESNHAVRMKEETFTHLLVVVTGEGRDLYDGLHSAFEKSTVEYEGHPAHRRCRSRGTSSDLTNPTFS